MGRAIGLLSPTIAQLSRAFNYIVVMADMYPKFMVRTNAVFYRNDYLDFAEVCFKEFGDRVKHWITFNEPLIFSTMGYASGTLAPGRCTPGTVGNCPIGDSSREPYIVGHNILLAHAAAVKLYRNKYQVMELGPCLLFFFSFFFS